MEIFFFKKSGQKVQILEKIFSQKLLKMLVLTNPEEKKTSSRMEYHLEDNQPVPLVTKKRK